MYKDTITLFKRDPDRKWHPTILRNVNLNMDRAAIVAKYGEQSSDAAILNVQYTVEDGQIMVGGKPWESPKEWRDESQISFTSGNDFDFFWLGEWDEGTVDDTAYFGGFYQWMNKNYDFVFAITGFSMFTVIPHFEVTGR